MSDLILFCRAFELAIAGNNTRTYITPKFLPVYNYCALYEESRAQFVALFERCFEDNKLATRQLRKDDITECVHLSKY